MSARDDRIDVYAVATAHEMGVRNVDLAAVRKRTPNLPPRIQEVIALATLFDELVHENKSHSEQDAISEVRERFESEIVEAFLKVQPLIQPVEYV
ncbi:MAG: hypothetical protein H0W86_05490 [Armatimonadetes bacterium]|nr:hypothetical protein [Armatimonadota bacterium]